MELVSTGYPGVITNFEDLVRLEPTQDERVIEHLQRRPLPVFVDIKYTVYHRSLQKGSDTSFRRTLQEIQKLIFSITGNKVIFREVEEAVFESFQNAASRLRNTEIDLAEANQKVEELLNTMIAKNASDLHIKLLEKEGKTAIRFRINGLLVDHGTLSFEVGDALLRSLWVNYAESNRTEGSVNDGSFYYSPRHQPGQQYMVRMTEAPEIRGTIFVARIRDPNNILPLEKIGYNDQQVGVIRSLIASRQGLASINGPTNSGKSSSQSTILSMMPRSMHILEVGDPVETHQPHVAHLELDANYPGGKMAHLERYLISTVRQDPDILALTEMRDEETSRAAIDLTSQGKFVITTMHTTDFVSSFARFQRIGFAKEKLVEHKFLRGLVCQKLLPRLCECSISGPPNQKDHQRFVDLLQNEAGVIRYRNPNGCHKCNYTGVSARVIVAEAVEITWQMMPIIRSILFDNDPEPYYEYAQENGILNIHQHALKRIGAGEVDPMMAEMDIGRFGPENLLWLHPAKRSVA